VAMTIMHRIEYNLAQYDNIPTPASSENFINLSKMVLIKSSFGILSINCLKKYLISKNNEKY